MTTTNSVGVTRFTTPSDREIAVTRVCPSAEYLGTMA
jgi:hypothetical protein